MIEIEATIKRHIVNVVVGPEHATFTRKPKFKLYQLTTSIPITAKIADRIEKSGIVQVEKYSGNGTLLYTAKPMYTEQTFIEVIADVLEHYLIIHTESIEDLIY